MKIVITGARGNLGVQLVKAFEPTDPSSEFRIHEIVAWDRDELDITDKDQVLKKINEEKPDVIINSAAYNNVDKCEESELDFELAKKLNCEAVGYLAEAALDLGAVMVHFSSDYVFDGSQMKGYHENDKTGPISKYGESKLMGEKEIISRADKGLKWYLIRTSKLFGPKGESKVAKPNFFDIMLHACVDNNSLDIVNEEVSCFTYTPDLAEATKKLVEGAGDHHSPYGVYHIVNTGPCTWFEAARELFNQMDIHIELNPVTSDKFPRPAKRPKYSVLLNSKFDQMRDWRQALHDYLVTK